jgi:hypothetical protein
MQAFGFLIVDYAVRFERGRAVIQLHVAQRGDPLVRVVVVDHLGTDEHLLLPAYRLRSRNWFLARRESQLSAGTVKLGGAGKHRSGCEQDRQRPQNRVPARCARADARAQHHPSS